MKTICYFSSYFESDQIPYYIRYYLLELKRHCNRAILITNDKKLNDDSLSFLRNSSIELLLVKNEGFDFGMWAKALLKYPPDGYERVILANDSCVLFRKLDAAFERINSEGWDYSGMIDSNQIAYHIQSYFLVVRKEAIEALCSFLKEEPLAADMPDTIHRYEVGLSQYMLSKGLRIGAVYTLES
ncbi:MAG TPA: rhamnan synthesis F family protein, partial [Bacteroidia bacterium]|nr:rhamnan synthesis F family protein [Bacteroidia bacterium]